MSSKNLLLKILGSSLLIVTMSGNDCFAALNKLTGKFDSFYRNIPPIETSKKNDGREMKPKDSFKDNTMIDLYNSKGKTSTKDINSSSIKSLRQTYHALNSVINNSIGTEKVPLLNIDLCNKSLCDMQKFANWLNTYVSKTNVASIKAVLLDNAQNDANLSLIKSITECCSLIRYYGIFIQQGVATSTIKDIEAQQTMLYGKIIETINTLYDILYCMENNLHITLEDLVYKHQRYIINKIIPNRIFEVAVSICNAFIKYCECDNDFSHANKYTVQAIADYLISMQQCATE